MKKYTFIFLSISTGIVFIISAYLKTVPIEPFELMLVEKGFSNFYFAPFISRFIIGIEYFIGIVFISTLYPFRKTFLLTTLVMVFLFSIFITYLWIVEGSKANCNCFGTALPMTPFESLIKNIVLIGVILILYIYYTVPKIKYIKMYFLIILIITMALTFIINPIGIGFYKANKGIEIDKEFDIKAFDKSIPKLLINEGKQIFVFLSFKCIHCKFAAYKLSILKKKFPNYPIVFILNGEINELPKFQKETKTSEIPFVMLFGEEFIRLAGYSLPSILFIENNIIKYKYHYEEIDKQVINSFLDEH